ncbi:CPBP family intramembrane glutamic endopeptidase [Roseivirga sp. E12]|uniref:CPBP family intramembrane glutamic endopeptidase n=1 Tax=Roseivirga sp. E12 TaxID=2819237 RepID=UPI001ABC8299|nr:CPBP family intramembrane glutamic endopeptidase [Roseivirga sp. E12]MBO3699238.1 CPBP family intramembrane metalloprotease [Roseivirga sp. E12]
MNMKVEMSRSLKIRWVLAISLGFVLFLNLVLPLRSIIGDFIEGEKTVRMAAGIIIRFIMFAILVYLIRRFKFEKFIGIGAGIEKGFYMRQSIILLIPMVFITMGIISDFSVYVNAGSGILTLFLIEHFFVALIEELAFRAIILPLVIQIRANKKRLLLVSVCLTSLIFGALHYLNLFREPGNFSGITFQVVFASAIGIFLGGLLLRTRHIIFPIMIHFLVNAAFGKSELRPENEDLVTEAVGSSTDSSSLFVTLGLFVFVAIGGVVMIRKVDRNEILNTLNTKIDSNEME